MTQPWNDYRPVVVVVRHPDYEDEISTFTGTGEPLRFYLDLGRGFDITNPNDLDTEEAREWVEGQREEMEDLPAGHPAREVIQGVIDQVREAFGLEEEENN